MDGPETSYDQVHYPGFPFEQTHPDRLSTVAALFGLDAAPVGACRVLELGCGDGGNLIPMAYALPGSRFVGLDLSGSTIAEGQAAVDALGLSNIELRHASITEVDAAWGRFDYIVAHGVYSWVPAAVRTAMWRIFRDNLAPKGVVYVSFNAYPGAHLRELARGIARFHTRDITDLDGQIRQSAAILRHVAETAPDEIYRRVVADQVDRYVKRRREVVFHDDLNLFNDAFHLYEVAAEGERHGLRYLTDAALVRSHLRHQPTGVPEDEVVAREQYQDFAQGTSYREAVFCRSDLAVTRAVGPDTLDRLHLSAFIYPGSEAGPKLSPDIDPASPDTVPFRTERGDAVETDHGLAKAAFLTLRERFPQAIATGELIDEAFVRLGAGATAWDAARRGEEVASLKRLLWTLCIAAHVTMHRDPPPLARAAGLRPEASAVARHQLGRHPMLTSLRHNSVLLEGDVAPAFLAMLDGTRTRAELLAALKERFGDDAEHGSDLTPESVEQNLGMMARLGLLRA